MITANYKMALLNMIGRPAFCAKDGKIIMANQEAEKLLITPGSSLGEFLPHGKNSYLAPEDGCLFLTLRIGGIPTGAAMLCTDEGYLFTLDAPAGDERLQALALAAQQLRVPLSNIMTVAQQIFPTLAGEDAVQEKLGQMNRGIFQMLRILSNMADAQRYTAPDGLHLEPVEFSSLFDEIAEKLQNLLEKSGRTLQFTGLKETLVGMGCPEALERAVSNLLANALKFSPADSCPVLSVKHKGNTVRISLENSGSAISSQILGTVFTRYQRQPGIEDGRYGIGLGMALVRAVAAGHGGTVLVQELQEGGSRVTMTLALQMPEGTSLRCRPLHVGDYTGGWDHCLTELSEVLSSACYQGEI